MSQPTQFHSYIIKMVGNVQTCKTGWRIVGLWGDEEKGEGNRIGPTFDDSELDACEALADDLEKQYGLPVEIATIISHFTGIYVGSQVETKCGKGVVEKVTPQPFPFLVRLENGTLAWACTSDTILTF